MREEQRVPPEWARSWCDEATREPHFAALFGDGVGGRQFVLACLRLAPVEMQRSTEARAVLNFRIVTANRRALIAELSGLPSSSVSAASLEGIRKSDADVFSREDWMSLLTAVAAPGGKRLLGHLGYISAALLRQVERVPEELRLPRLLEVATQVGLTERRWERVREVLGALGPERRDAKVRAARRVKDRGGLWDWYYGCVDAVRGESVFVELPRPGVELAPLDSAATMIREGRAMKNCLATRIDAVLRGEAAYFRWHDAERATVELVREDGDWRLGAALGRGNAALGPATLDAIRRSIAGTLGPSSIEGNTGRPAPTGETIFMGPEVERAIAIGQTWFDAREQDAMAKAIASIAGRSVAARECAFCIIQRGEYFVQCLSILGHPVFLFEISSHRYVPSFERRLTDEVMTFIERCDFRVPRGVANFARDLPAATDGDLRRIAAFALGVMYVVFEHRSGDPVTIKVHIPGTSGG